MAKRRLATLVLAASAVALSGCPGWPPANTGPVLESVVASATHLTPGEVITVTVVATDSSPFTVDGVLLGTPSGALFPNNYHQPCSATPPVPTDEQPEKGVRRTTTATCTVPTFASNGTWEVMIYLFETWSNGAPVGTWAHVEFEVTGGSDDDDPPVLESYEFSPTVIHPDSPFEATLRFRDESFPILSSGSADGQLRIVFSPASNASYFCAQDGTTLLEPDLVEVHFSCAAVGQPPPGTFTTSFRFRDALGHMGKATLTLEVTAP